MTALSAADALNVTSTCDVRDHFNPQQAMEAGWSCPFAGCHFDPKQVIKRQTLFTGLTQLLNKSLTFHLLNYCNVRSFVVTLTVLAVAFC